MVGAAAAEAQPRPLRMATLSQEKREELQGAFALLDKNGSGKLEVREIGVLLNKLLNRDIDEIMLGEIVSEITDSDSLESFITYDMFEKALAPVIANISDDEFTKRAFMVMDKDGDGHISGKELAPLMSSVAGKKLRDAQVDEILKLTAGDDGTIQLADYSKVVSGDIPTLHKGQSPLVNTAMHDSPCACRWCTARSTTLSPPVLNYIRIKKLKLLLKLNLYRRRSAES